MSEKRYFKIEYGEEWYLFDSTTISEELVKEQAEYGYGVFANSLSPSEVVGLLNEQQDTITGFQEKIFELRDDKEQLHTEISKLRQEVAELKTRNAVLSSKLNQIPENIKEVWLE